MRWIGLAVALTFGLTIAPLTAEAQQAGKVFRVGHLAGEVGRRTAHRRARSARRCGGSATWTVRNRVRISLCGGAVERLPGLAAELVGLKVDVIVVQGERLQRQRRARRPLFLSSWLLLPEMPLHEGGSRASHVRAETSPG